MSTTDKLNRAIALTIKAMDRSRCEAERTELSQEVIALLKGLAED